MNSTFRITAAVFLTTLCCAATAQAQPPAPPRWTATRDLRIDAVRQNLVVFANLAVGPSGEIAIPQQQDGHAIIFDSAGKRLGVAGRRGSGPGEFGSVVRELGWIGDTLWVGKTGTLKVPLFTRTGTPITERTMGLADVGSRRTVDSAIVNVPTIPRVDALLPGGAAVVTATSGTRQSGTRCPCIFFMNPNGTVRNMIGVNPPEIDPARLRPGGGGSSRPPFPWFFVGDQASDGSRVGWLFASNAERRQQQFRVVVVGQRGDTVFNRTYAFAGERIPQSEVDAHMAARSRNNAIPPSEVIELKKLTPPYYQPWATIGAIKLGLDGTIWIGLRVTAEGNPWLVLDAAGAPIARVMLSANVVLLEASRQRIWGSEQDVDGLRSIVRYAVRAG